MTTELPPQTDAPSDASAATSRENWLALIDQIGEEAGYFQPLGTHHWAYFVDESPNLLVTFETIGSIRDGSPGQLPMGHILAAEKGWSHLCLIAEGETWYRDEAVYRYFDRLVDDAFFEDFDNVVFYGADMAAYAACAYSVTAPGATVLAIQPRATLDPAIAGWDTRDRPLRRLNFTDRYGYAPDMIDGTGHVFVVFDPMVPADAMHAALFTKPYVTKLRAANLGSNLAFGLTQMKVLPDLIRAACEGRLCRASFARALRQRRSYAPYLKHLLALNEQAEKPRREAMICRNVIARLQAPRFRKRLAAIKAQATAPVDEP